MLTKIFKLLLRASFRVVALLAAYALITVSDLDLAPVWEAALRIWPHAVTLAALGVVFDFLLRAGRAPWRFASIHDLLLIARSSTVTLLIFVLVLAVFDRDSQLAWPMVLLTWVLDMGLQATAIVVRRSVHERAFAKTFLPFLGGATVPHRLNLLLLGGLDSADAFLRELSRDLDANEYPVGIISLEPSDVGRELRAVKVVASRLSPEATLQEFADRDGDRALVFLDDIYAPADIDAEVLGRMRGRGVRLLRRTRVSEVTESGGRPALRDFNIEELLARPPVDLDVEEIKRLVSGRRVLITGAGGSIGSEICRQVAALGCARLSMLDNSEVSLFNIDLEIGDNFPGLARNAIICDIRDPSRVKGWMVHDAPEIVFHAAALKHVPLMEQHPCESALTNVVGTWNVASAARECGVAHMVFISTDKAVDPGNVMGATKRLAESVVRSHRSDAFRTRFSVVRFGNVLGSAGSVVPTFVAQIKRGGPLTVTHEDVERYFMTIPEAVQLVLHATAKSASRNATEPGIFVLDMGKPVKIIDLAKRLIELSDKTPGRDIEIQIVGLRPGEKLTEALVDSTEESQPCDPGVLQVIDRTYADPIDEKTVRALEAAAHTGDAGLARRVIFEMLDAVRMGSTKAS